MSSEKDSSPSATPVWSTGPEQTDVELVITGEMYKVDVDIAKRMEGVKFDSPFGLTGCSSRDFERALTFCANDRSCSEKPSRELARIIKETALPGNTPPAVTPEPESDTETSGVQQRLADLAVADEEEDEEDESYVPSESEESDSEEEYSDIDPTDIGTANIKAERDEYNARQKEKEKEKEKESPAQES